MAEPKLYTEREKVDAERDAFVNGASWGESLTNPLVRPSGFLETSRTEARLRYRRAKVTRPRVVTDDNGIFWRVVSGRFEYAWPGHNVWKDARAAYAVDPGMTPARVRMLNALLDSPTEEVPDDE